MPRLNLRRDRLCPVCAGQTYTQRRLFPDCHLRPCHLHVGHFQRVRCWFCMGSGKAGWVIIAWRKLVAMLKRRTGR